MADTLTPMMRQYRRIKAALPSGVILFFRLGDFYEMFFEDAKTAAPILDVALTKRNGVPMCGLPFHALESYLAKLIRAGRKVAICDQMEAPSAAQGIVRREVTRVVTPGTVTEDHILEFNRNNFLAGIGFSDAGFGLALLDLSTGLFQGEAIPSSDALRDALRRFAPTECVVPAERADDPALRSVLTPPLRTQVTACEGWPFAYDAAYDRLVRHFGVHSLDGFGCERQPAVVAAAGGVLYYVKEELHHEIGHIRSFRVRNPAEYLFLDETTCSNLDLVPTHARAGGVSLLQVLDVTCTAMGGRLLREWLLRPLADLDRILRRHDAVAALVKDRGLLQALRETLGGFRDLERLVARTNAGSGNARDLRAVGQSLEAVPEMHRVLLPVEGTLLAELGRSLSPLPELTALIDRALVDDPPISIRDGGIIKSGYHAELDELRHGAGEGRRWLAEYQAAEMARTGIRTLKVRHNKVFGYYLEVSKGQLGNVPAEYIRKQTLVNAERFITPELKEYENRILGSHERAVALEQELFAEIRNAVVAETTRIQETAAAVAQLDVLSALADRALALRYVRPVMTAGDRLRLRESRHPVIEQMPEAERFVPNDVLMDGEQNQLMVITGPNMAGKSTYIRQVALIVVMAQTGSFVPAAEAEIGLVDRVFTRVGASDDLARGRSTFMVEMQETANILNNATPRSLIVLDEIGRGTSTFDGISIAWAVAEYLHNNERVKAKTLFATHYHELTDLSLTMKGVRNYNVLVREQGDRIVFLRRIVPGGSDKSYGIQVARLAGLPEEVVDRAREILANLEEGELGESGQPNIATRHARKGRNAPGQMTLFGE